jgi:hypothetical protein
MMPKDYADENKEYLKEYRAKNSYKTLKDYS